MANHNIKAAFYCAEAAFLFAVKRIICTLRPKQTTMNKIAIIAASIIISGCAGNSGSKTKNGNNVKVSVTLTSGQIYTSGDKIVLQCQADNHQSIDSLIISINHQTFRFGPADTVRIPTGELPMGSHNIGVEARFTNGSKATGRSRVCIKSDIEPEKLTYRIVRKLPHSTRHYTQGLEFDGDPLYEGTGIAGQSAVYKTDFKQLNIVNSINLDNEYFGEGISIMGDKLYQLTWQSYIGFIYNKHTLNKLSSFSYSTEGWGLTNDGNQLIMSDGSEKIYFIDTATMRETRRIEVYDNHGPVTMLNELEYADSLIYANIYCSDYIVAINPANGKVLKIIDMHNLLNSTTIKQRVDVLNGIARQPNTGKWFVTGKLWPTLFEVEFISK